MKIGPVSISLIGIAVGFMFSVDSFAQGNPFLRPGSKIPVQPLVRKPAPPPPKPIPVNPNLEFRGYFKLKGVWYFALFDKSKNRGEWLQKGQSMTEGGREIERFDLAGEQISLKGGWEINFEEIGESFSASTQWRSESLTYQAKTGKNSASQKIKYLVFINDAHE